MGPTRIVVADDHRSLAVALAALIDLEGDLAVAATVYCGREALAAVRRLSPDVLVVDADLGDMSGVDVTGAARLIDPAPAVVVVTGHASVELACAAIRAGATAFVTKDEGMDVLLRAVRGSIRGEGYLSPVLLPRVFHALQRPDADLSEEERLLTTLTGRELEILHCLEEGLERRSIASRLFLSVNTVRTHTRNLLTKLNVHSSLEAVALASRARQARNDRLTHGCPLQS
jgi:DNA-binding NarL/FixJ family response regulator